MVAFHLVVLLTLWQLALMNNVHIHEVRDKINVHLPHEFIKKMCTSLDFLMCVEIIENFGLRGCEGSEEHDLGGYL